MAEIVLDGQEPSAFAQMIGALLQTNTAASPEKARILETTRGVVEIAVTDAGVVVGLKFTPGALVVTSEAVPGADLRISADSETLMGLANVPLRFGLPDALTAQGREVGGRLVSGRLRVHGLLPALPRGVALLRKVNRLLSVA